MTFTGTSSETQAGSAPRPISTTPRDAAPEEKHQLLNSIGLLLEGDAPSDLPLSEMAAKLCNGAGFDQIEPLDGGTLALTPPLGTHAADGMYNRAVFFFGERSKFTVGLEQELREIERKHIYNADFAHGSALSAFLGESAAEGPGPLPQELLEVCELNEEQREAIRSSFSRPITVVTGPPGTGKSQLVLNVMANAYWRGERVLFASYNQKAVSVVEGRFGALTSPHPLLLRAGKTAHGVNLLQKLVQFLTGLLGQIATEDDRSEFKNLQEANKRLVVRRAALWKRMEECREARNRAYSLDRQVQAERRSLDGKEWDAALSCSRPSGFPPLADLTERMGQQLKGASSWSGRLKLWARRSRDFKAARKMAEHLGKHNSVYGTPTKVALRMATLEEWLAYFKRAQRICKAGRILSVFRDASEDLKKYQRANETAEELAEIESNLWQIGQQLLHCRRRLLPDKLMDPARLNDLDTYRQNLEMLLNDGLPTDVYRNLMCSQEKLFPSVSSILPLWAVTNLSVRGSIPLRPGLFDLVVIDEASQCNIPSCLPLLLRAKRALIIGDNNQLRHISTLDPKRNIDLLTKHHLQDDDGKSLSYPTQSLFDYARRTIAANPRAFHQLREHFRSHADIIGYSNRQWYGESLLICTNYVDLRINPQDHHGIVWEKVEGEGVRPEDGSWHVDKEANAVVKFLSTKVEKGDQLGSVGIVTPFRAQSERIKSRLAHSLEPIQLQELELIVDTAHGFQGDERDTILFSPCVTHNLGTGAKRFLESTYNLFNVAVTRARRQLYVFGDANACGTCGIGYIEDFVKYVQNLGHPNPQTGTGHEWWNDQNVGHFEKSFFDAMVARGLHPIPQYHEHQFRLDFALLENGKKLNVETDGKFCHTDWDGTRLKSDVIRDYRLRNLGWTIKRFWAYEVSDDMDRCVNEVWSLIWGP